MVRGQGCLGVKMTYDKNYYERNKEKHNAKTRADYQKHRVKRLSALKAKRAERTDEKKEEDRIKMREYYNLNKDRINKYSRDRYAGMRTKLVDAENKIVELESKIEGGTSEP